MSTFSITRANAKKLLTFCKANKEDQFFICKDHGAYIGATTGSNEKKTFKNSIHYVKGCNPDTDEDSYEEARYKFGGDDFGEHLPVQWLEVFFNDPARASKRMFSIKMSGNSISLA